MGEPIVSVPKVPDAPGWWWREEYGDTFAVNVREFGGHFGPRLLVVVDGVGIPVTADGCWIAPVLTAEQADALTRDLAEARATLDAVAALVGGGDVLERVRELVAAEQRLDAVERAGYV